MELLPGTKITAERLDAPLAARIFDSIFAGGGLYLSQVAMLGGIELYSVQNWVKRGFVSPPVGKKYSKRQFCRLITINMLKSSMSLGEISQMLTYINGRLCDESDDMIGDDDLYLYFIALLSHLDSTDTDVVEQIVKDVIYDYDAPSEEAAERLATVLTVMYFVYRASELRKRTDELMSRISPDAEVIGRMMSGDTTE